MNQTRTLLIFAWLMVAILLWMEWRKEDNVQAAPQLPVAAEGVGSNAVPSSVPVPGAAVHVEGGALPKNGRSCLRPDPISSNGVVVR